MRPGLRWLFGAAVVVCGVIVLVKGGGATPAVAAGVGLILAGVEPLVP